MPYLAYHHTDRTGRQWYAWFNLDGTVRNGYYTHAECLRLFGMRPL